ncbi:MAG: hypothetical protein LQ352_005308 [Teloschistes flavicans]|nr:MAG: hypothetical protein LQ352_005308 [Teloschistes flavicans]
MSADQNHKAQPWKAHWSPKGTPGTNQNYMKDDSGSLLIDGCCSGACPDELVCSREEIGHHKTQPWKAHWAPETTPKTTPGANQNYMKDDNGFLLIDGISNPPGGHGWDLEELVCSRKEIETTKTQPWKAHWFPKETSGANQNYMKDDSGRLLIDGACSDDPYFELSCSRKAKE